MSHHSASGGTSRWIMHKIKWGRDNKAVVQQYLDIFLQCVKLRVQTCLTSALRDALLQLFQLVLLPHLVSDLHILALLIEAERPSTALSRGAFETFIIRSSCRPRRIWIGSVCRCGRDCGYGWWGWGIPGISLAALVRVLNNETVRRLLTLIDANLGCMGLYLSFLDCGAGMDVSKSSGCAAIFKPTPC